MGVQRRLALTGAVAAMAMSLTACGGFGNGSSSTGDSYAPGYSSNADQQGVGQSDTAQAAPKTLWTLRVAATKKLGKIMVDSKGMTLYRFDTDTARPSKSNCVGTCAKKWPPVTITSTNLVLKGFDATLLGKIHRQDGTWQLTLNGWPLYRYAKDTKSGEWKGQGVDGTWYVAAPTGKKAIAKVATSGDGSSGSSGASGGGYDSGGGGYDSGGGGYDSGGGGY
jgi:predicted lipoprotein with Yx(FWY)xxD motif